MLRRFRLANSSHCTSLTAVSTASSRTVDSEKVVEGDDLSRHAKLSQQLAFLVTGVLVSGSVGGVLSIDRVGLR